MSFSWTGSKKIFFPAYRPRLKILGRLKRPRLALPTSDHGVAGSNAAGGEILPEP